MTECDHCVTEIPAGLERHATEGTFCQYCSRCPAALEEGQIPLTDTEKDILASNGGDN